MECLPPGKLMQILVARQDTIEHLEVFVNAGLMQDVGHAPQDLLLDSLRGLTALKTLETYEYHLLPFDVLEEERIESETHLVDMIPANVKTLVIEQAHDFLAEELLTLLSASSNEKDKNERLPHRLYPSLSTLTVDLWDNTESTKAKWRVVQSEFQDRGIAFSCIPQL